MLCVLCAVYVVCMNVCVYMCCVCCYECMYVLTVVCVLYEHVLCMLYV